VRATLLVFLFLFIVCGSLVETASAGVIDFNVRPENPVKGDTVTVSGTAQPNEEVRIDISFEKVVLVSDGKYVFSVDGIKIPDGKNRFTVSAYGCIDLDVSARKQIIGSLYMPWITLGRYATNDAASISQSVPSGTYDVDIHGKSGRSSVKLKITATGYIKAGENGKFSYSYDTSSMPPGEFVISVGGISKVVTLRETSSGSGGMGGGSASPPGEESATPTLEPTQTPKSSLTPTPTQVPIHVQTPQTIQENSTHVQPDTSENTSHPETTKPDNIGTSQQTQKTSKTIHIPGFSFIWGLLGLIAAAIVYRQVKFW